MDVRKLIRPVCWRGKVEWSDSMLNGKKEFIMLSVLTGLCLVMVVSVIVDATVIPSAHGTILEMMHGVQAK